jgi:S1-C subfamily serine protease
MPVGVLLLIAVVALAPANGDSGAIEDLRPAVVSISGSMRDRTVVDGFTEYGTASGFVFDPRGFLFTVYSPFVDRNLRRLCERFEVTLADGRVRQARMWVVDPLVDLAILKIDDGGEVPAIQLPSRAKVGPGDRVMALAGAPAEKAWLSVGEVFDESESTLYGEGLADLWIDIRMTLPAHANGGPLVNERAEVVGITVPGVRPDADEAPDEDEAHALPVFLLTTLEKVSMANPTFEQPWLGLVARRRDGPGLAVEFVWAEGPAARAGLRTDDVLRSAGGRRLKDTRSLEEALQEDAIGGELSIEVERDGQLRTITVTIEQWPRWAAP